MKFMYYVGLITEPINTVTLLAVSSVLWGRSHDNIADIFFPLLIGFLCPLSLESLFHHTLYHASILLIAHFYYKCNVGVEKKAINH